MNKLFIKIIIIIINKLYVPQPIISPIELLHGYLYWNNFQSYMTLNGLL
jgi:hypothetical protein